MSETEIRQLIQRELPTIIAQDPLIRDFILRTVSNYYAGKQETESKFDRILAELQRDREEQARKWDENNRKWEEFTQEQARKWDENNRKWEEQNRKWEEQNHKWEEQNRQNQEILLEIKALHRKYDSTIGALGSRWGLNSEASFRNALAGILTESFGVQVLNVNEFDRHGEVFGRPDQVELDVIIKNGLVIACEIKSSMSKSDIYTFARKVEFYERHHQQKASRKLVISPMVEDKALPVAEELGIEVYSYAEDVPRS